MASPSRSRFGSTACGPSAARVCSSCPGNPRASRPRSNLLRARGYLLKRSLSAQLKEAIRAVHRGERYLHPLAAEELVDLVTSGRSLEEDDYDRLTLREKQVFKLLAEGKTSRDIAKYLSISLKTAMTHRANIMGKLGVHSRAELIRLAIRKAVITLDEGP